MLAFPTAPAPRLNVSACGGLSGSLAKFVIVSVMPTATVTAAGIWFAMVVKVVSVRKLRALRLKTTTRPTSTASSPR